MTFQRWTEDQTLYTLLSPFFSTYPLYARVGHLQPFARIHKSWTVLIYNVFLGLMVVFWSMSSVDSAYKHTHINNFNNHSHSGLYYITYKMMAEVFQTHSIRNTERQVHTNTIEEHSVIFCCCFIDLHVKYPYNHLLHTGTNKHTNWLNMENSVFVHNCVYRYFTLTVVLKEKETLNLKCYYVI